MEEETVIIRDKIIKTGSSPITDESGGEIGRVNYHFWSFHKKVEMEDAEGVRVSTGRKMMVPLPPRWVIRDSNGKEKGIIRKKFSFFRRHYFYENDEKKVYKIVSDTWGKNLYVVDENGDNVLNAISTSSRISFRPHTYRIRFERRCFSFWEAMSIVQGMRSLAKEDNKR